jgi:hypothetical protein
MLASLHFLYAEAPMRSLQSRTAVLSLLMTLVACGGGGGGSAPTAAADSPAANAAPSPAPAPAPGLSPAPAPAASPTPSPSPAPSSSPAPAPVQSASLAVGPVAQFGPSAVSSGFTAAFEKRGTAVTRLAGGGAAVAWLTADGLFVQRLDASGQLSGSAVKAAAISSTDGRSRANFSIAAAPDGGWVLAWASSASPLQFRRYDASGAALGEAVQVGPGTTTGVSDVQVRVLADGSVVVAWSAGDAANGGAMARNFSATGAALGDAVALSSATGPHFDVNVTALPDGTFLAAWLQGKGSQDGAQGTAATIGVRHFDATLSPLGAEQSIPAFDASELSMASLADGTTLLVWGSRMDGVVHWQLLDNRGVPTSSSSNSAQFDPFRYLVDTIDVVPAAGGFTAVVESTLAWNRGQLGQIAVLAIDAAGTLKSRSDLGERSLAMVSTTTATTCGWQPSGVAAAGGEDGRYVIAYDECAGGQPTVQALAR